MRPLPLVTAGAAAIAGTLVFLTFHESWKGRPAEKAPATAGIVPGSVAGGRGGEPLTEARMRELMLHAWDTISPERGVRLVVGGRSVTLKRAAGKSCGKLDMGNGGYAVQNADGIWYVKGACAIKMAFLSDFLDSMPLMMNRAAGDPKAPAESYEFLGLTPDGAAYRIGHRIPAETQEAAASVVVSHRAGGMIPASFPDDILRKAMPVEEIYLVARNGRLLGEDVVNGEGQKIESSSMTVVDEGGAAADIPDSDFTLPKKAKVFEASSAVEFKQLCRTYMR